jgi:hypothetical protein
MNLQISLICWLLILVLTVSACTLDPNEQFIQGSWEIAQPNVRNPFFRWRFSNGTLIREQGLDSATTLYTTGSYRLIESSGDELTIELFNFSGDCISYEDNPMTIKIEIDRANDSVRITNVLFVRAGP